MTTEQRLKKIISETVGADEKDIVPSARFVDDLGLDSLDLVEVVMSIEQEFHVELPDQDAEKLKTVQDALDYLEDKDIV